MSVSNKVALWAILPAVAILVYGIASIIIYQPSIDARVSILSSIATSVTVLFLISERLRESARRKLDYLNRKALTAMLQFGKSGIQSSGWGEDKTISACSEMLAHHGRFLKIKLYPNGCISLLDRAKDSAQTYDKFFKKLMLIGNNRMGAQQFNVWMVLVNQGFMEKGNYTNPMLDTHKTFFDELKTEDPELYEGFPKAGKALVKVKQEVAKKLEDFFVDNQLEEYKEPNPFERGGIAY